MDTTKRNQAHGAQDSSDDLIAELARLVAQDARSSSANTGAQQRETKPDTPQQAAPQPTAQPAAAGVTTPVEGQAHAQPPEPAEREGEDDFLPMLGLTGGTEGSVGQNAPEPEGGADDPIAQLISDAELDEMRADAEADARAVDDLSAGSNAALESGPANVGFADISLDDERWSPPQTVQYGADEPAGQPAPETDDRDPLKDIEALIGEAARVSAGSESFAGRRVKSSFLAEEPQPAEDPKLEAGVDSAEAAILAATAASGVPAARAEEQQTHFEPQEPQPAPDYTEEGVAEASVQSDYDASVEYGEYAEEPYAQEEARPERRRPAFLIPAVAGALLFAVIGGVYFAFFAGSDEPGEAPVLTAEGGPMREDAPQVANTSAASDSVVFNELSGNTADAGEEMLVSRDQTEGVTGGEVSRIITPEEGEMELANRPVRTVTVRPDGSIVNAEDSVAGSNVLPVERPDVPDVPSSSITSDPIGEAIALAMAEDGDGAAGEALQATEAAITDPASLLVSEASAGEAEATDAVDAAAGEADAADATGDAETAGAVDAPLPIPRPEGLNTSANTAAQAPATTTAPAQEAAPQTETVASVDPSQTQAPAQPEAASASSGDVAAWVQLSSQRSEETARAGIPELQSRYGALFNGADLEVSRVDLGDRGIYYRVRLPQPSLDDATGVCNAIRGQGGDCFVLNN